MAATIAALLTTTACAQADGGATPATATDAATLPSQVVLTTSGGIAGRQDTVTVRTDGHWTRVDRSGAARTGQLTAADLDRLRQLATDPRLAAEATATAAATMCADAFTYRLTVGRTTTGYVDCPPQATPPAATGAVVDLLNRATG
ncbi:protealysin inhibitor emfourin [Micromonospora sp. NPDC048930]|uniref:protealysin inhibitor emfourin n=1 Tax=Micromonospora sp. NPDC048930 TaxID=3364261 RepID=UPI00371CBB96